MMADDQQLALDWDKPAAVRPCGLALSAEEQRVLSVLERHRGREAAISSPQLAAAAGVSERRLRDLLRHLVLEHQVPLGSSSGRPAGYWLIASDEERVQTRDSLLRRGLKNIQRSRAYDTSGFAARLVGQFELAGIREDEE